MSVLTVVFFSALLFQLLWHDCWYIFAVQDDTIGLLEPPTPEFPVPFTPPMSFPPPASHQSFHQINSAQFSWSNMPIPSPDTFDVFSTLRPSAFINNSPQSPLISIPAHFGQQFQSSVTSAFTSVSPLLNPFFSAFSNSHLSMIPIQNSYDPKISAPHFPSSPCHTFLCPQPAASTSTTPQVAISSANYPVVCNSPPTSNQSCNSPAQSNASPTTSANMVATDPQPQSSCPSVSPVSSTQPFQHASPIHMTTQLQLNLPETTSSPPQSCSNSPSAMTTAPSPPPPNFPTVPSSHETRHSSPTQAAASTPSNYLPTLPSSSNQGLPLPSTSALQSKPRPHQSLCGVDFFCPYCIQQFESRKALDLHVKQAHARVLCGFCEGDYVRKTFDKHVKTCPLQMGKM